MVDAVFGSGLGIGAQFWGKLFDKQLEYYFQVVNELGGADAVITTDRNTPTGTSMDSNPALVFRTVWHAMGGGIGGNEGEVPDGERLQVLRRHRLLLLAGFGFRIPLLVQRG